MISKLELSIKPGRIAIISSLLQRGFIIKISAGSNLLEVLIDAGFTKKYIEERVQTIFLDGRTIDNPQSEIVADGSVVALSSALPGLAGAIFRRGSSNYALSKLRTPMHEPGKTEVLNSQQGYARIKLFNLVAREMGPELLRTGLVVVRSELEEELAAGRSLLESSITSAELDGKTIDLGVLFAGNFTGSERVCLSLM